jgi:hypothetical protein
MLSVNYSKISKPLTAQCNLEHFTLFLLSETKHGGCCRLAQILENVSDDSIFPSKNGKKGLNQVQPR